MATQTEEQPTALDAASGRTLSLILLALTLFLTAAARLPAASLRVAVISDLNGSYGTTEYRSTVDDAVARIVELEPDLVINTGDMVAGQRIPHLNRGQVERMWHAYHAHVSQPLLAAGIPVANTPGNHDGSAYSGFSLERSIYQEQWLTRKPTLTYIDDTAYPWHYAFSVGDVLFIGLDATVIGHLRAGQTAWLRTLLEQYGSRYKVRVLFSHLPLWPFTKGREREYIGDPALQSLLDEFTVQLYLSGHHHAFYPGIHHRTALVSQSCLGAGPRRLLGDTRMSPRSFTLIEIEGDDIRLTAFRAPDFTTPLDWHTLPERIRSDNAELVRADLANGPVRRLERPAPDIGDH